MIGTAPNKVPTNGLLGTLAFQDRLYLGDVIVQAADPTTAQIPDGKFAVVRKTDATASTKVWANIAGTLYSVAMS